MTATTYGPQAATRADAARASMRTAAVNADRTATAADREAAAEREMAAYESYWHAHGAPAYAPKGRDIMTIEGDPNAFWYDGEPVTPRRQAKQQERSGTGMTAEENQFYAAAAKDPGAAERFRAAGAEKTAATIEMVQPGNAAREADQAEPEAGA